MAFTIYRIGAGGNTFPTAWPTKRCPSSGLIAKSRSSWPCGITPSTGRWSAPKELITKYEKRLGPGLKDARYGAMIEAMDVAVGRVLAAIDEAKLTENTLIIFTSDNGAFLGVADLRPLRAGKGFLYEGGIRVPLIVSWSGKIPQGSESSVPVISMDLFPTMLAAGGLKPAKDMPLDGENLMPLLTKAGKLKRDSLYFHYPNYAWHGQNRLGGAIREKAYMLIENFDDNSIELYDLKNDLGQQKTWRNNCPRRRRK